VCAGSRILGVPKKNLDVPNKIARGECGADPIAVALHDLIKL
jgi:hypothetical protein